MQRRRRRRGPYVCPIAEPEFDIEAVVAETIEFVTVRPDGDAWVGDAPDWWGTQLFGGFILGQATYAATRVAPEGRRIHSLHGYFLRPIMAGAQLSYRIAPVREGRTFSIHRLEASQQGKPVFTMTYSFTADTEGYEYELPMADVPPPDDLETGFGPGGPWEGAWLGPTPPEPDGTMRSTHRAWNRIGTPLPDDRHLHAALIAFATDTTGTGGRPLHLDGDVRGMISIDHAAWFHRTLRADDWHFYDVHSLVNTGGRGLLRGTLYGPDRHVAVSVAQEMLLRPYESFPD
ncbi:MAG: thioesterase family protein [Actinobacteria bacterium]|nr:thioesterase family protein [Actinomycetota bacterium]